MQQVNAYVGSTTPKLMYADLETPQDECAAGHVASFGKTAKPVLASDGKPYALGLSAKQTHLAPTWIGGDQIAIHPGPMGAVSNGCIHATLAAITLLRRVAPLGTLVIVRA